MSPLSFASCTIEQTTDVLFSLQQGGDPIELDPVTLETLGVRKFDSRLPTGARWVLISRANEGTWRHASNV